MAKFKCANGCKVYVDKKEDSLRIFQRGKMIATFAQIVGENKFEPAGLELPAGENYVLEKRGEVEIDFVMFVVNKDAPNYNTPVYVPQSNIGISFRGTDRYVTFLSSFEALTFSGFAGEFPAGGFPFIYGTGFDAAGAECNPVYRSFSQKSAEISSPTIATAMFTIDFGFVGAHNVSVNQGKVDSVAKGPGRTTVFTSTGYVGCSFTAGQNYYSKISHVHDEFIVNAISLDIFGVSESVAQNVYFRTNEYFMDFGGTRDIQQELTSGPFATEISWTRSSPEENWAILMDYGPSVKEDGKSTTIEPLKTTETPKTPALTTESTTKTEKEKSTTTSSDLSTTSNSGIALSMFAALFVSIVFA